MVVVSSDTPLRSAKLLVVLLVHQVGPVTAVVEDSVEELAVMEDKDQGADGWSREAIRHGGLWKFLTVRQIYPQSNQS